MLGRDVWSDPAAAKALMGVLPDGMRLFDRLSGAELLRYVGLLRRVPPADIAPRSAELLEALGLTEDRNTLVVEYSAGMTKKIGLACALIHAPRLLILDEPFESVDPVSGERIRAILRNYVRGGGTVVMSSHVMELVESLCDELAVVAQGRVLAAGTLDEVRAGRRCSSGSSSWWVSPAPERRRWRGCDPRPAQAESAAQQPAPQRLAHRRPDRRHGLRAGRRGWPCWSDWSPCAAPRRA